MTRTILLGALAGLAIGMIAPAQAAHMANPGLSSAASGNVEQVQYYYRGGRRHWRRHHWRGYAYHPRRCWTQRVWVAPGVVRYVRRCR
jgi:hypothetical protein